MNLCPVGYVCTPIIVNTSDVPVVTPPIVSTPVVSTPPNNIETVSQETPVYINPLPWCGDFPASQAKPTCRSNHLMSDN